MFSHSLVRATTRPGSAGPSTLSISASTSRKAAFAFIRHASNSASNGKGPHIPIIRTLGQLRRWRKEARDKGLEVGVVPTMGALHEGHLNLVRASLSRHPLTVMTLFVNPMQFAPHEDLSSYPRTFERDLSLLQSILPPPASPRQLHSPLVIFAPTPDVMYPLKGELQDLRSHKGVEVDVRGWAEVMEGASRPQFFKGVATVCTKLFNAVEPDHAYFGQKDIQQALLLRILVKDLLLSHPTSSNLHILPTTRSVEGLALSSRNAYLSKAELSVGPILHKALASAKQLYEGQSQSESGTESAVSKVTDEVKDEDGAEELTGEDLVANATRVILEEQERILGITTPTPEQQGGGVELTLDYIEIFDKDTFEPIRGPIGRNREFVLAGAIWVGKTRLIDNLLVGWETS
ncbi:pantoate-beta-alanine ligase [Kwoniella dejecticola CBS 10117]|uniref:Pantoate--beta-alanine ligase n=1 Tax=Kwoniella dejecticola CBS 10117 TaxID=1296121 RepID=A0A1A6AD21_9TREE|nr:pantoate-beta-alanine ligase [Kwoniella dejecticola CBS 10117]OBR87955.1 pantoate-beta-alanine ligase [Kwoniella dejecticola CBS 10117]